MEEYAVVNETPVDAGTEMDAADLLAGEEQQPAETVEASEVDAPAQEGQQEDDAQIAIGKEMQRIRNAERSHYEQQMQAYHQQHAPAISVGERILNDIMRATGATSLEQAAQVAQAQYVKAVAARENVSENVARAMFMQGASQQQFQQQPQQPQYDVASHAEQIKRDIAGMELPQGFDFAQAIKDEGFAQMLLEMPTQRAVQLYHAEQRAKNAPQEVAEKLRARQALPQPGRPNQPLKADVDYAGMSSEEFRAFKVRKQQAEMNGTKIRL